MLKKYTKIALTLCLTQLITTACTKNSSLPNYSELYKSPDTDKFDTCSYHLENNMKPAWLQRSQLSTHWDQYRIESSTTTVLIEYLSFDSLGYAFTIFAKFDDHVVQILWSNENVEIRKSHDEDILNRFESLVSNSRMILDSVDHKLERKIGPTIHQTCAVVYMKTPFSISLIDSIGVGAKFNLASDPIFYITDRWSSFSIPIDKSN